MEPITFSRYFGINKTQFELDFVDIPINDGDIPLYIDPYALSKRNDLWSTEANALIVDFFQQVLEQIIQNEHGQAKYMLSGLHEPNQTRLGLSKSQFPKGRGVGGRQSNDIYEALLGSSAIKSGLITDLEECELLIDGIGADKISDITTNIIRPKLIEYTQQQCALWEIPTQSLPSGLIWNNLTKKWASDYVNLPICDNKIVLLVPKSIARYDLEFTHQEYYQKFVLEFLQNSYIDAKSSLVRTLKDGTVRPPYKKSLKRLHPISKKYLYEFSMDHPEVLKKYRDSKPRALKELSVNKILEKAGLNNNFADFTFTNLGNELDQIPTGTENASKYHDHMIGVLTALFSPNLINPRKEMDLHEGRKRIDITFQNAASRGFFYELPTLKQIASGFIFVECKNYSGDPANPELDQLSGRFSINRGKFGILVCRTIEDKELFTKRCRDTAQDGRGFIIALDDSDIKSLLKLREGLKYQEINDFLNERFLQLVN